MIIGSYLRRAWPIPQIIGGGSLTGEMPGARAVFNQIEPPAPSTDRRHNRERFHGSES
jgi:hypothetical protein